MAFKCILTLAAAALPLAHAASLATGSAYQSPSTQWSLLGCVQDQYPTNRVMSGDYTSGSSLTVASCLKYCASKSFHLAGIENGNQCYCSQELYNGAVVGAHGANLTSKNNDGCNVSSAGNKASNGGGNNHLLVFQSKVFPEPSVANVTNASHVGCFADDVNSRLLPQFATVTGLTNEACVASCQSSGYDLAGTENTSQCWCGKSASVTLPTAEPTKCNLACAGAKSEYCGGSGYLNVYSFVAKAAASSSSSTKKAAASSTISSKKAASSATSSTTKKAKASSTSLSKTPSLVTRARLPSEPVYSVLPVTDTEGIW